jgi:predicted nucleic acid-binding protein
MLLISDANVIIDMQDGGLLEAMFQLDETFAIPDMLYAEELEQQQPQLPRLGLQIKSLSGESIARAIMLKQLYSGPSTNDLFALELARECQCPLLTGDMALRRAAESEGIELRGTLWLVEQLIVEKIITVAKAQVAYQKMRDAGSRLPWAEIERQIKRLTKAACPLAESAKVRNSCL